MSEWQNELNLKDIWESYPDELSIQELSGIIAERLKKLIPCSDENILWTRDDLVDDFICISEDELATEGDFNYIMNDLYDWGDIPLENRFGGKKVCWIKTKF